jgi:Ca2+-binding EF-hand superfamily protein
MVFAFLFHEPRLREPHELTDFPLDRIMDRNQDGLVDEEEIRDTALGIGWIIAIMPLEPLDEVLGREAEMLAEMPDQGERFPVRNFLDELADLNGDGMLEPRELEIREVALEKPHEVESEFDRRIDFNKDGMIEEFEIRRAVRAEEFIEPERAEMEAFPVRTPIDAIMDLNEDGHVDPAEIEILLSILTNAPTDFQPPRQLYRLFDDNENGRIDRQELFMILERFLRPHPADPDLPMDKELDVNKDGFVGPEEIGVAAGVTEFGEIPSIEELLERMRWMEEIPEGPRELAAREREREADAEESAAEEAGEEREDVRETAASPVPLESDFYRKLGEIQDKKLAVVGLTSTTKAVDRETTDGIVVFVENAFVNVGKVKVVDRQNIEKIMAEHEFQQSDVTDETTAVQIGKLAGANIIVIGSISYVGERYYLNIKLISVETAEIMGSSIADAAEASQFLDMTNEAVYKLF